VHLVGSYSTDISRCTLNKILNFHISYPNKVAAPHLLQGNKDVPSVPTRVPSLDVIGNRFPDAEEIGKMSRNQGRVCLMVEVYFIVLMRPSCGREKRRMAEARGKGQLETSVERAQVPCVGQM